MKFKCKCGKLVVEGEIGQDKKGRKIFEMVGKPQGTILKNKSKNPDDWMAICSKCQAKENV